MNIEKLEKNVKSRPCVQAALAAFGSGTCLTAYAFVLHLLIELKDSTTPCDFTVLLFLCALIFALFLCSAFFAFRVYKKYWELEENQQGEAE